MSLPAPQNLVVKLVAGRPFASWSAVAGAARYRRYTQIDSGPWKWSDATATSFTEMTAAKGAKVALAVSAIDSTGKESPHTPTIAVTATVNPPVTPTPGMPPAPAPPVTPPSPILSPSGGGITLSTTTIPAGLPVHAHIVGTPLASEKYRIEWNFFDPSSQFNYVRGFNAAHIYEKVGTYTITVRATDTETGLMVGTPVTASVVVTANTFAPLYVSAAGNDANDGKTASTQVKSIARANALLTDNRTVYLAGNISTTTPLKLDGRKNIIVRGAGATLSTTAAMDMPLIHTSATSENILIDGLALNGYPTARTDAGHVGRFWTVGIEISGKNIAVRNCTFNHIRCAWNGPYSPSGVLIQGNHIDDPKGMSDNGGWLPGSDIVVLGNTIANSTLEHCLRFSDTQRVCVFGNTLTNTSTGSTDLYKGVVVFQSVDYAYAADNIMAGGFFDISTKVGNPTGPASDRGPGAHAYHVVVEGGSLNGNRIDIEPGTDGVRIEGIAFDETHAGSHSPIAMQTQDQFAQYPARQVKNITVRSITCVGRGREPWVAGAALMQNLVQTGNVDK